MDRLERSDVPATDGKRLRYLWAFSACTQEVLDWHQKLLARRLDRGYDIVNFCVTPNAPGPWLTFPELDRRWRRGDRELYRIAEELEAAARGRDVLILFNGTNLHPDLLRCLSLLKIYHSADDPESTELQSKPVASYFDMHLVANIAAVEMYRSWGLKRVHFWPLGSQVSPENVSDLSESGILDPSSRHVRLFMACERGGLWRRNRLDALAAAFPQARFVGHGWKEGYITSSELGTMYRTTQIGWNIHNSTGPINFRTYDLPAHGVLQICDNRCWLGELFELGSEVVGFDSIHDCIELTRYYLSKPDEQRRIAWQGHLRWRKDYTPDATWDRLVNIVAKESFGHDGAIAKARRLPWPIVGAVRRFRHGFQRVAAKPFRLVRKITNAE